MQKYQRFAKQFIKFDCSKFTHEILDPKINDKEVVNRSVRNNIFTGYSDLDKKLTILAREGDFKAEEIKIMKIQGFDSSYFCGKSHFEDNSMQNYLVFQSVQKYFKKVLIVIMFQRGKQKDCLMKVLKLLLHLKIVLLQR